jgi:hypothetical protein
MAGTDPGLLFADPHRRWDPLRGDPRFKDFLRRVGVSPEYAMGVRFQQAR